jgi:phosphoserine phosphatase RsbU/P
METDARSSVDVPENKETTKHHGGDAGADDMDYRRLFEEQSQLTRRLTQRAERGEAEVVARTQELETAQRRSDLEQQLIGIVSHDLRNPIQAISMGTAVLLGSEGLGDHHKQTLQRMRSSAERASRLIHDLLDFTQARLGGGIPVTRREGDLFAHLEEVIHELEGAHPRGRIQYQAAGSGKGWWDRDRLAQVVSNLVTNALRYGTAGGEVRVTARDLGEEIRIEVHNRGDAIAEELLPRLFRPLQRGMVAGDDGRSIGLGLFISKEIVAAHQGNIAVSSSATDGTTFSIQLPRK